MKKHIILSILLVVGSVLLIGCAPKGEPSEVLNSFYECIKNNDSENSYELLSTKNKEDIEKDDFIKWENYHMETCVLKDAKVEKVKEYKEKELDGEKYKNVVEFNVKQNLHDNYNNKDLTEEYTRYVVNDNNEWKVYKEKTDIKRDIAESMTNLAGMYYDGAGKNKDINQAATLLNEAINISKDVPQSYYLLGTSLTQLERYDEAIENIQIFLNKDIDNSEKSNAYNVLGVNYQGKKDYSKAVECYNKAIEMDANNQYAKTNLQRVNTLIALGI
ncbi:tetratricopeptide repeat protein [uncultured Clostridium sp.]|uniref:tetratricopeptide repeat protein n=1 Tax=uncultured Clostridium sp. TaxID=59620 RepID=UPI0028EF2E5A|nr:tetratricopeptide repeat protein [uncultured Clostridium sp.]